jgi:hypothetical protein
MTTQADLLDRRLDAIAILEAALHGDDQAIGMLLDASDDPDHWRGVASVLVGMLAVQLRHGRNPEGFIAYIRERTFTGDIADDPLL